MVKMEEIRTEVSKNFQDFSNETIRKNDEIPVNFLEKIVYFIDFFRLSNRRLRLFARS